MGKKIALLRESRKSVGVCRVNLSPEQLWNNTAHQTPGRV